MSRPNCEWLDDYLAKDLAVDAPACEFEKHVPGCGVCRTAIEDWQSMCQLLKEATTRWRGSAPSKPAGRRIELRAHEQNNGAPSPSAVVAGRSGMVAACVAFIVLDAILAREISSGRFETGLSEDGNRGNDTDCLRRV